MSDVRNKASPLEDTTGVTYNRTAQQLRNLNSFCMLLQKLADLDLDCLKGNLNIEGK